MDKYTVSELSDLIKKTLNKEFRNKQLYVSGEISNVKTSGKHTYLTLKDDTAQLNVAFWNSTLDNEHGDHVEITGCIDMYIKTGNINLIGSSIKNIGVGSLHTEYEKLKKEYDSKGYFNNKRPLPQVINKIGVITALGGAALKDFLYVLSQNEFAGDIYIYDCSVQGTKCPMTVAQGIKFFNSPFYPSNKLLDLNNMDDETIDNSINSVDEVSVDCIVITRGGGSFEDLMGFSHPKVIEAIYASKIYTISAVGHEIDNMLSDYVANYRAPTPSIAGTVVSSVNPNNKKKLAIIESNIMKIKHDILQKLFSYKKILKKFNSELINPADVFNKKLNKVHNDSINYVKNKLSVFKNKLQNLKNIINTNDINTLFDNGFMLLTDLNNNIIYDPKDIFDKELILVNKSGSFNISINQIHKKKKLK